MIMELTPTQSRELAKIVAELSPMQKADFYYFTLIENQDPYEFLDSLNLNKHLTGQHDQETHGSWAQGREYVTGKWEPVEPDKLVQQDVDWYKSENPYATSSQISALKSKSKKYYKDRTVISNGSTVVTFENRIDKNKIGVDEKDRKTILEHIDYLQENYPLENISILADSQGGSSVCSMTENGNAIRISQTWAQNNKKFAYMGSKDKLYSLDEGEYGLEFTLSHEWGHAFNNPYKQLSQKYGRFIEKHKNLLDTVSTYGRKSDGEGFAETFAQNLLENKLGIEKMEITKLFEAEVLGNV
jgi:hypothetical protein